MEAYLLDWANLLLRWLHLIAGVAWIGASFYFVMLDNSLSLPQRDADRERGVHGELWAVHGGGVYHSEKYLLGPRGEPLADKLHWSKWEAYTTWLSGMGLMAVIYWLGASTYLIDRQVMELQPLTAVLISFAFLLGGWVVYHGLCKLLKGQDLLLAILLFALISLSSWLLFQIFSARAAYLHVGAMMGTMMAANVFFCIIPGQKKMVSEIRAGVTPDPEPGVVGKQRSVHNTYFTLPVLFIMISNHYPMTYSHEYGWLILILIMIAGALIRQYFVMRHSGRARLSLPAIAVVILVALIVVMKPPAPDVNAARVTDTQMVTVMANRCASCHAMSPSQPGFDEAPAGLLLQTLEQINSNADRIASTVQSGYMPIGNLTGMTDEERALVANWYAQRNQ